MVLRPTELRRCWSSKPTAAIQIAVADPTQANGGAIHIEIDRAATGVMEKDDTIAIDQMSPAVRLTVNVANARGRSLKLKCATRH
jgi:hyaluronate lyase